MNLRLNIPYFLLFFCLAFIGLNLLRVKDIAREPEFPLDQRQPFFAGKLYVQKNNPYSDEQLKAAWQTESQKGEWVYSKLPGGPENYMLYPPFVVSFYSLFQGMSWFSWGSTWYWIQAFLMLGLLFIAFQHFERKQFWIFLGFFLSYKALIPAIMLGQPLWISLFAALAYLYFRKRIPLIASLFLAITAFKPSLALPLFAFALVFDFRQLLYACVYLALFHIPFFLHYGTDSASILMDWRQNMLSQQDIVLSDSHAFLASNLIDISPILGQWGIGLWLQQFLLMLSGGFILYAAYKKWYSEEQTLALLLLAGLSFSYHLYYDAFILLIATPYFLKKEWWYSVPLLLLFLPGLSSLHVMITPSLLLLAFVLHLSGKDNAKPST